MRLTKKDITYITSGYNVIEIPDIIEGHKYTGQAIIKLGQLEDIEEELGIDLITLFKALKNGIYGTKYGRDKKMLDGNVFIEPRRFKLCTHIEEPCFYYEWGWPGPDANLYELRDYGKTWALTKEELE